ncbi:MAG: DUF2132 domain-containing protein [Sulfurospirillum sp.]|jgi:uncharacterized protein (DUF2132 family)|nr:DUF2132 domain-containing protein [Sulfurospirillum sp.]MBP9492915.1 DUF2132 domain-containing protein [Sulfurospirillum sp.]MBP9613447.1 DUF2132 domain-containing protein [Sulfurospirillum sp.]
MQAPKPHALLHGITLEKMITELHAHYGWEGLDNALHVNCFHDKPSLNSSLKFFRKTPWAREKLEKFYIAYKQKHLP